MDHAKIGDWLRIAQQITRLLALLTAQFGACHRFSLPQLQENGGSKTQFFDCPLERRTWETKVCLN